MTYKEAQREAYQNALFDVRAGIKDLVQVDVCLDLEQVMELLDKLYKSV